ncbi:MAG TPA: protein kinase [Vicinamibacterales bacterium]|nr:protein kinase [Vicinamibacterales bacterium]
MSDRPDAAWLVALGTDVAEGRAVDWNQADRLATDRETQQIVESLKQLAAVVEAQRSPSHAFEESGESASPTEATRHWRHLVLYERVGAGAFGSVFRGWDTQLDREVAVKLLTKQRAAGISPLLEAKHLARVRHPNVVTVYGAEQDQEQFGIWMEFIHGDTLAAMVEERGPMSAREVAGIGIDLCRALSSLHGASLLHRDIKAHNVMREVGGRIVLMDFSGVRALLPDGPQELSGTPLYMAPELLAGHEATIASEVYSLGVLLFYLLSGRYPVEGATLTEIKAVHATGERIRLRDLRPELPEGVVQVVEQACSPDPRARHHTVGQLEHALLASLGTHVLALPAAAAEGVLTAGRARGIGRRTWLFAAAALAAVAALGALWPRGARPPDPLVVRMTLAPPYNDASWPRVSPDGRAVLFGRWKAAGQAELWVWPLDSLEGRPFTADGGRETPFFSPDSQHVGFFADGKLMKIAMTQDAVPEVLADVPYPRGGDWNASGTLLFASETGIDRINADGTGHARVTVYDTNMGENRHAWPEFLPDGRRFLYLNRSSDPERTGVYLGSLDRQRHTRLMPAYSRTVYARSGHLLFVRDGALMAQAFDERTETLSGEPIPLASNVRVHTGGDAAFDVSDTGVLVYRPSEGLASMRLQLYDRRGQMLQVVAPTGFYRHPRLSPDGRRVAVERLEAGSSDADIWLFDLVRGTATRFTSQEGADIRPAWSPDGRRIAFSSRRGTQFDVYVKTVDRTDPEELIDSSPGDKLVEDWSQDGQSLAISVLRSGLWIRPLSGNGKPTLVQASKLAEFWHAEFSPDGRYLAYVSSDSGREDVYVEPLPQTGERWQMSTEGGADPHWRADGRELIYLARDGGLMSVELSPERRLHPSAPMLLFRVSVPDLFGRSDLSISETGEQILVNDLVGAPLIPPVHVIVNWQRLVGR